MSERLSRIGHCSWLGERNRSGAFLILKYFTIESGSICATKKNTEKDQEWKVDDREEEISGKMRSLADMDKFGT